MKPHNERPSELYFLSGGGEMGELTRAFDWAATSLGSPEKWPQSLRLTLSMVLTCKFPMFIWWGEDLIQFYNDAYRPSLGNEGKHPRALGQKGADCWPEIWETIYPLIRQVRETAQASWSEDQLIPIYRNGRLEDVYWTFGYSPIVGENGRVDGVLVVCTENTEKVQATKAMEQNERQMRSIVENAPFPIGVYLGREMRIALANPSILQVWGKGNDVIGKRYADILPELDNQPIFAQLDLVFTTGKSFHARNQRVDIVIDEKLQPYYFNYSFTPLFDDLGNVYGVMNTGAEISDLNEAAQKIAQSERNFRNIILRAPVAMCILLGPDHVVEIANDLMIELWGKPVEMVMSRPIFEGLPDAREQGLEALLSHVYNTGETFHASERPVVLWRNGRFETVFQNFVFEPYKDSDGLILGVLAISIDVTDQVLARQKIEEIVQDRTNELALANDNLLRSNAELAQFAYIASHDLQEPLRKISTYMQMLENRVADRLDEKSLHFVSKIQNASARMHTLVRDVLAYSEVVKESDIFSNVDLNEVLAGIVTDYELLIEQKGAIVHFAGLPVVEAIPLQMSQLFGNLVGNALKFARNDVKPEIRISCALMTGDLAASHSLDPHLNYYKIQVADNGIGFEKEYQEKIFYIFQRLHRKSEYEGTGIGLAMCKKIALNHHGDLNAAGSSANGAVFNIFLPAKQNS